MAPAKDRASIGVLCVDDEESVRIYSQEALTEDKYRTPETEDVSFNVFLAASGNEALEILEEHTEEIGVVFLDRMMPGLSGAEVLDEIREREYDVRVGMFTAVEPELDIIDMEFDDYLTKPMDESEIRNKALSLAKRRDYGQLLSEYQAKSDKLRTLRNSVDKDERKDSEKYNELLGELRTLRDKLDETADSASTGTPVLFEEAL